MTNIEGNTQLQYKIFQKPLENEHQIKNYLNLANKKPWISRRSGPVGDRVARFFTHYLNAKKTLKFSINSYDLVLSPSNSRPKPDESPTSELYLSRKTAFKNRWIFSYRYRKVVAQYVKCTFWKCWVLSLPPFERITFGHSLSVNRFVRSDGLCEAPRANLRPFLKSLGSKLSVETLKSKIGPKMAEL